MEPDITPITKEKFTAFLSKKDNLNMTVGGVLI